MFTSDRPQWCAIYETLAAADVDHIITYDDLDAATGRDFRAAHRAGLDRAVKELEHHHRRTVECARGRGCRIVRADEHERLGRKHQTKARRQVVRAQRKVASADRRHLDQTQARRLDDLEALLAQQETVLRRTARRVEEIDTARKLDARRLSEEIALLQQNVERIQHRIDHGDRQRVQS